MRFFSPARVSGLTGAPDGTLTPEEGRAVGKINSDYLQSIMVEALEDFGGAAHPSTLAEYAMNVWGRCDGDDDEGGRRWVREREAQRPLNPLVRSVV